MMVVILTPVDGIIRWLPRGFSCSPNSGTVGGFGHMGPNDPYNDGHSGSGSSGGSFNGGGNGGHDNSSGSSYTASFGLITGRHPITVPGTKNINSVDLSAVINNIIGVVSEFGK